MANLKLVGEKEQIVFGNDSIVIRKYGHSLAGGRVLDVEGFTPKVINAGHVIIKGADGYKPMPLNAEGTAYASLPANHTYAGVLYRSILTAKPAASIMTAGVVNEAALPFAISSIKSAFVAACPHSLFESDEAVYTLYGVSASSAAASESTGSN